MRDVERRLRDLEAGPRHGRQPLEDLTWTREVARLAREADAKTLADATVEDHPLPSAEAVPGLIDHTLLKHDATAADVERVCCEARDHAFASVCVHPRFVALAADAIGDSGVVVCTVIGFPLGASTTAVKILEAAVAIEDGARELDMVLPLGALRAGAFEEVAFDIAAVVTVARARGSLVKVILETGILSPLEQATACLLARGAGADFVKTSTGFFVPGAQERVVRRLRAVVGPTMGVKASGGIRTRRDLEQMVRAGASRIGTSSGPAIMREYAPIRIHPQWSRESGSAPIPIRPPFF